VLWTGGVLAQQPPCLSSAQVLIYGAVDESFLAWLPINIPSATFTQIADCSNNTDGCPNGISSGIWNAYNLVIIASLNHSFTLAEQAVVVAYLNLTGEVHNIIALAGFVEGDYPQQETPFAGLGITYNSTFINMVLEETINPLSPLTPGVSFLDFDGGYGSTQYTGQGTSQYIITSASDDWNNTVALGQTIQLPSGGRIVVWGDEWITYAYNYETSSYGGPVNQDDLFWKNAINWSGVCVPNAPNAYAAACGTNCEVLVAGAACEFASVSSTSKCVSLALSDPYPGAPCVQT